MGWYYFKAYANRILIDQLLDTNKGWNESLCNVIGDFEISSLDLHSMPTQYKRKCRIFET